MAISPLELYEKAYQLQYESEDIPAAVEIYKRIIGEFPDSNECGYAAIQLEKLQATKILSDLERGRKQPGPLAVVALVASIVAITASAATIFLFAAGPAAREADNTSKLCFALGLLYAGKEDDAAKLLAEILKQNPANSTATMLAAEVQVKMNAAHSRPAQSFSVGEEPPAADTEALPARPPATKNEPVAPPPPVLSRQQKALSQKFLAKPAPRKPAAEPTGFRPVPAAKPAGSDSISFFP